MAFSELYVCDTCQHDVVLVHAQEWQPGRDGQTPQPYVGSGEVGGLWNVLWCPACRAARPHIFLRLDPPGTHAVVAYAEAQRIGATGKESGPCPVCATLLTWQVDGVECPGCETGHLRMAGQWEDAV